MENIMETEIDWRRLADELLEDMYECYGEKWTAQWLWDAGFKLDEINYMLGTNFTEDDLNGEV